MSSTSKGKDYAERISSDKYPAAVKMFRRVRTVSAYIDGELCAIDEKGMHNFALMQMAHEGHAPLVYYAFDLLFLEGEDLTGRLLLERKKLLKPLIEGLKGVQFNGHHANSGADFLADACKMGLEGLIAKRVDAPYLPNDRGLWIKTKCHQRQEFVIVGWTDPDRSRVALGALLLGYYRGKDLVYAGR
jgi:bifunctional non-homologous end joining protein LigD